MLLFIVVVFVVVAHETLSARFISTWNANAVGRDEMGWGWDLSSLSLRVVIYGAPRLSQVLAVNILGRFLVNTDKNIRCVGCVALLSVRPSPPRTLPDPSWPLLRNACGVAFFPRFSSRGLFFSMLVAPALQVRGTEHAAQSGARRLGGCTAAPRHDYRMS